MTELSVQDKEIVVPGQELASGMSYLPGPGTYRDEGAIRAQRLGMVRVDK